MDEPGLDPGWSREPWWRLKTGRIRDVRVKVINKVVVHCDLSALECELLEHSRSIANEANTVAIAHDDHVLEVPIRTIVTRGNAEIVISGIFISYVGRLEVDVWVDTPAVDTVA